MSALGPGGTKTSLEIFFVGSSGLRVFGFSWLHFRRYAGFITIRLVAEGWEGWDEYAPFYDWENARTLGRRDVAFWQRLAAGADGPVLELGCGTGRITIPLAKHDIDVIGVDRSEPMLNRALARTSRTFRTSRTTRTSRTISFVRADVRALPFRRERFSMVLAPY